MKPFRSQSYVAQCSNQIQCTLCADIIDSSAMVHFLCKCLSDITRIWKNYICAYNSNVSSRNSYQNTQIMWNSTQMDLNSNSLATLLPITNVVILYPALLCPLIGTLCEQVGYWVGGLISVKFSHLHWLFFRTDMLTKLPW